MPEGHKTHHLAKLHHSILCDHPLRITSPQGRFRGDARKVNGQCLSTVRAAGKHMFYEFDSGRIIHVHLGRYGKFRQHDAPPPLPVGQVRMRMVGADHAFDLTGPSTCRVIDQAVRDEVVAKLGPDPLDGGRSSVAWENVRHSSKPIGGLLLDQAVVAGVGNIFRAEVLFETRLDPYTPGNELSKESFDRLWRSLRKMMRTGLKYGRIISVTAREAGVPLSEVQAKDRFRIYGKTECPSCGGPICTPEIAARKLYLCESCQTQH
ncbi:Fpg/Nei family DNA glycosylase [Rubripirellula sp.]|nr:Fpg/Nei family DNA glycosylase [Rubripirellula sp.]